MPKKQIAAEVTEAPTLSLEDASAYLGREIERAERMAPDDPATWGNRLARLRRLASLVEAGGEVHLPAVAAMAQADRARGL